MLRPALGLFRGDIGDDVIKLLPPRCEGRDDLFRRHPACVIERELMEGEKWCGR